MWIARVWSAANWAACWRRLGFMFCIPNDLMRGQLSHTMTEHLASSVVGAVHGSGGARERERSAFRAENHRWRTIIMQCFLVL